jgi:hypothetical protein
MLLCCGDAVLAAPAALALVVVQAPVRAGRVGPVRRNHS